MRLLPLLIALLTTRALALPPDPRPSPRQPDVQHDPLSFDGRDFRGVRFRLEPVGGAIELQGNRASVWTVGSTRRVLLEGDVRVSLGAWAEAGGAGYSFQAARACVWLERVDDERSAGGGVYQVFAYLEHVSNPGADPTLSIEAEHLGVEGMIRVVAPVSLRADRTTGEPPDSPFVRAGEIALAAHLRRATSGAASDPGRSPVRPAPRAIRPEDLSSIPFERGLGPALRDEPIFASQGIISASAGQLKLVAEDGRSSIILSGGVNVEYEDRAAGRILILTSEQGVVFLRGEGVGDATRFTPEDVEGIYLEGGVAASDGEYSIRASDIYYDVRANRALILKSVFWTYDQRSRLPVYVRADAIRQESANQFVAERARVATSAFFEPHISIGASSVTLTRLTQGREAGSVHVDARDITLRAGGVPFFYWPMFQGDPSKIPIRSIVFQESSATGAALKTSWRLKTLLGDSLPPGVSGDLLLDWYFERGPALGADLAFGWDDSFGEVLLYSLPSDVGRDQVQNGSRLERDGEFRGIVSGRHTWLIDPEWTLRVEAAHASDPTLVPVFFPSLGRTSDEFTNRVRVSRRLDRSLLSVEAAGSLQDFVASESELQSDGYSVDRLPEASYVRLAEDVLADSRPGLLLYDSEHRLGALSLNFDRVQARERGYTSAAGAAKAFGVAPGASIADALHAAGLSESVVTRLDSRHELSAHADASGIILSPFVAARLTAYDDDFASFSPIAADEPVRVWGSIGASASTTFVRIDDAVASRLLDLNRLRHIVVPSVTVWHADTTLDHAGLPVYDESVESIAEGSAVKFALDQTLQTHRGGAGRSRSVDVLSLNTEIVLSSSDADVDSPLGRFFDSRPEDSNLGDFLDLDGAWQATEVFAITGNVVYDLDASHPARETFGYVIDHSPDFSTFADLRYLAPLDSTYLGFGSAYRLTPKYSASGWLVFDTDDGQVRLVSLELVRRYPDLLLRLGVTHNAESDDTSFGFAFQPSGIPEGEARLRGLGSDHLDQRSTRLGG